MAAGPPLSPRSLLTVAWSLLGLALAVFSFAFTIFLALAVLFLPWLLMQVTASLLTVGIFFAGILISITLLRPLVPWRMEFRPPGARLDAAREARLFEEIRRMAARFSLPAPDEIYVTQVFNAAVCERGGTLGFGCRRVLIIGLPLFSVLTIGEFRALLAHEFAHSYGQSGHLGHSVLALNRSTRHTLARLAGVPAVSPGLDSGPEMPWQARLLTPYWKLFLRPILWVSRQQEFQADAIASRVAGGPEMAGLLTRLESAPPVLLTFIRQDMVPAIMAGYRPPFIEGLRHRMTRVASVHVREVWEIWKTHPPTSERLAAIATYPAKDDSDGREPAATLLSDVDALEVDLIRKLYPQSTVEKLRAVPWARIGVLVHLPRWLVMIIVHRSVLEGWKIADLPAVIDRIPELAKTMCDPKGTLLAPPQRHARVCELIVHCLATTLILKGWQLCALPGECYLQRGETRLNPRVVVIRLVSNRSARVEWAEWSRAMGIGDLPLVWPKG